MIPFSSLEEKQLEYCYGLIIVSPQKTYVEALTPKCDGIRWYGLWLDQVIRVEPL